MSRFFKSVIKKIFEPAKNPDVGSDLFGIEYQLRLLQDLDRALVELKAARKQLLQLNQKLRGHASGIRRKAKRAVALQREDLARIALRRRQALLVEAERIAGQIHEVEREEERLSLAQQRLTSGLEAYNTKRDVLSARQTAAEAQVSVGEAMGGINAGSGELERAIELAEKKRENTRIRAEAIDELLRSVRTSSELAVPDDTGIEQELGLLKRRGDCRKSD